METATIRALAGITDPGLFERLATAVVRLDPLYARIGHPGINADGRTIKAPVDGLLFVDGGRHLIAVHHTISASAGLRRKWLHVPSPERSPSARKGAASQPGDVVKTIAIVEQERRRTPELAATIVLTTTDEVDPELHADVVATARASGVEIDIWSRSRLAHLLDTHTTGQVIRRKLLGISEELLSRDLLAELCNANISAFDARDEPATRVARNLNLELSATRRPLSFIVGTSGSGKTVAAHEALRFHSARGGLALVVSAEAIGRSHTIDQAIMDALKAQAPTLIDGQSPTALLTDQDPMLILVEDICRTDTPLRLIERLAAWVPRGEEALNALHWRILCPVWPHLFAGIPSQSRPRIETFSVRPSPMSADEARTAATARAVAAGSDLSPVEARRIADALGNDPLLIGLNNDWVRPCPEDVIGRFVEDALERCALESGVTTSDLRGALFLLAEQMMRNRRLAPAWKDVVSWNLPGAAMNAIRHIAAGADVLWLDGQSTDLRLSFRHDRVRDWLLASAASELYEQGKLADLLGEPLLAEVMAGMVVNLGCPPALIARLRTETPLALFHGLRLSQPEGLATYRLVAAARHWFDKARPLATLNLQWDCLAAIEAIEASWMLALVARFPSGWTYTQTAKLRNGDIRGALATCHRRDFHTAVSWLRDAAMHRKVRHRAETTGELAEILSHRPIPPDFRDVLCFVGVWGEPDLGSLIGEAWHADDRRDERLAAYLWAAARCATPENASVLLDPICDAWAELPDTSDDRNRTPERYGLAGDRLRFAFNRAPPVGALAYFIERAQQPELNWAIQYMLHDLDEPAVLVFQARCNAERLKVSGDHYFVNNPARNHWERQQWDNGVPMSPASRIALLSVWTDLCNEKELRISAFDLWAANHIDGDLDILRSVVNPDLGDLMLRQRLVRGDGTARDALLPRLEDEKPSYWWQFARHVWSPELYLALDRTLAIRAGRDDDNLDWILAKTIMRLPVQEAEPLLLKHWDSFSRKDYFVQAALYVASPRLEPLVAQSMEESDNPAGLLEHLTSHFGIRTAGELGITRQEQIWGLGPYLRHLDTHCVEMLADECHRHGWYDLRNSVLAPLLPADHAASLDHFRMILDKELRVEYSWIDLSIDRAVEAGARWKDLAGVIASWLSGQRSKKALNLAADAIRHAGLRGDVALLGQWKGMDRTLLGDAITNTFYSVARRSAH